MLSKRERLTNSELVLVKEEGEMRQGRWFGVLLRRGSSKETPKFGLVVSSKVSKRAVERNKIKRKLREAVRRVLPEVARGMQAVVLGGKRVLEVSVVELTEEMKRVLTREGAIKSSKFPPIRRAGKV